MDIVVSCREWVQTQYSNVSSVWLSRHVNPIAVILGLLGLYFAYVLIYGFFLCPSRHIPGPLLTRFGKWYYYRVLFGGSVSADIHKLHIKYGPVLRLAPNIIDVSLPEAAIIAWGGQNPTKLPWDKEPEFCHIVRSGMKVDHIADIASIADARKGLRMRRLVGAPFAKKFLLDQEHIFKRCTKNMLENIDRLRVSQDGNVDVAFQFKKYAFDILTEFAYGGYFKGASIRPNVSEVQLLSQVAICNFFAGSFPIIFNILKRIPLKVLDWVRSRDEFVQICDISIREYKANVKPGSRKDSLSTLIASRAEDGTGLSHEELVGAAIIFIFAGVDTTSSALTFIFYVLAKHPEYIEKLAEEVDHFKDVDHFQSIELEKLSLLNAVIREALRLYPPAPGPIGRVSPPEGSTLGGYFVPAGIRVCRSTWAICRDPNLYPDPDSFKPERWLGLSRADEVKLWDQSMIFSYGPRVCLGREMALFELRMLLSAMILKYSWTGVPDTPGKWDEEMEPVDTMLIHPKNGKCVVNLKRRV